MDRTTQPTHRFTFAVAYMLVALVLLSTFMRSGVTGFDGNKMAQVPDMIYGRAYRPFVYRTLVPTVARVVLHAMPHTMQQGLARSLYANSAVHKLAEASHWPPDALTAYAVIFALMYLSLIGFAYAIRDLFESLFASGPLASGFVGLLALIGLPPFFYAADLYDPPDLFLFTLGLALMARRSWEWYMVVFSLASANKETSILLTLVFAIHFLRGGAWRRAPYSGLLIAQLAIYAVIQGTIRWAFQDNPGMGADFHLFTNLTYLPLYPLPSLLSALAIAWLVTSRWREQPAFLRSAVWIGVPLFVLTLFMGFLSEFRDYYEVYPILLLLAAYPLLLLFGVPVTVRAEEMPESALAEHAPPK